MSKYSNTIEYMIKTTVDKSGLANLQTEIGKILSQLKELSAQKFVNTSDINKSIETVQKFQKVLDASFNTKLGMLDMSKLNTQLRESQISLGSLQKSFSIAGASGDKAFASVLGQLGKIDTGIKNTSSLMDKLANTMGNTIRWGIMSSAFNGVTDAMRQAVEYAKDLDNSLTQIMLVTDYSRDSMIDYAKQANEAAKSLGATTTAMTNATLVFAQQGFDLDKSGQLAELSTKLANASQQDTSATSDQITAYMNAYGLDGDMEALSKALDSWAKVANISAADVSELAQASQKAASAASTLGVTTDQLNAQIATIESVTREAPEQIGNGLKTLYARFSDLQMGETLEDGVDLGTVTSMLKKIGVEVLDGDGKMRGVGSIMEDLMGVWSSIDSTQKAAVAQALAGKYQLSRFEALMNRSDLYNEYKSGSENASGTLDVMNDKYVDSLQGKLTKLQSTFEDILNGLGDSSEFYGFIDGLTSALDLVDKLVDAIGGGSAALTAFGAIATKVFSKQMASGLNNMLQNFSVDKQRKENDRFRQQTLMQAGLQDVSGDRISSITSLIDSGFKHQNIMNDKEVKEYNTNLDNTVKAVQGVITAEDELAKKAEATNLIMSNFLQTGEKAIKLTKDDNGILQASGTKDFYKAMRNSDVQAGLTDKDTKSRLTQIEKMSDYVRTDSINDAIKSLTSLDKNGATAEETVTEVSKKIKNLAQDIRILVLEATDSDVNDTIFDKLEDADYEEVTNSIDKIVIKVKELLKLSDGGEGEDFTTALANGEIQLKDMIALIEELQRNVGKVQDAAQYAKEGNIMHGIGDVEANNQNANRAGQVLVAQESTNADMKESLDDKANIKTIIDVTGAVGDLVFAWQSFQGLGSIWANADLTTGEKIEETILNLVFTLPQLITSIQVLSKALQGLDLSSFFNEISTAFSANPATKLAEVGTAGAEAATAMEGAATSGSGLAGAFSTLVGGINPVTIGLTALVAVLGVAGAAMGAYQKSEEERIQKIKEDAEEAKQAAETIKSSKASFDQLYQDYKNGADNADQLKSAADSLNGVIDDQSAKVAAAAGNWDLYQQSIQKAIDTQLQSQNADLWRSRDESAGAANKNFSRTNMSGSYNRLQAGKQDVSSGFDKFVKDHGKDFSDLFFNQAMDEVQGNNSLNDEEYAKQLQAFITSIDENKSEFWDSLTKDQQNEVENYYQSAKDKLNNEDWQNVQSADKTIGANLAQLHMNDPAYQYKEGMSVDDYKTQVSQQVLKDTGHEASSTLVDALVEGMAQGTSDSSKALAMQQSQETASENFQKNITENFDALDLSYDKSALPDKVDLSKYSKEFSSALSQAAIDQINNSSLSDEDKQKLMSNIDWSGDISSILGTITQAVDTGDVESALKNSGKHKKGELASNYEDNSQLTERLNNEYKVSKDTIDTYKEQLESTTELGKAKKELTDEVQQATDKFGSESKEVKSAKKELEKYNDSAEDVAEKTIQTQKGLDSLSESFSDNYKVLKNGDKTTLEYSEALSETKNAMADVLNVSSKDISNDFIENHLDEINDLANGDISALDDLRQAAAQDYVVNLSQEGNLTAENLDWLQDKITQISGEDIALGASLDDQDFIDGLNDMLSSGAMTVDQVNSLFGMMGYDPTISWKTEHKAVFDLSKYSVKLPDPFGEINLPPIKIMGDVSVPQIDGGSNTKGKNGPRKVGGGSGSHSGQGLSAPKSKGSSGGGGKGGRGKGGGGKGSGGDSYTPKKKDAIEDEIDRYEKVETKLAAIDNDYKKLNKEQERLTGKELAKNLAKQNELLQKQIKLYQEKMEIQKEEAKELQGKLSSGYGVTFDEEGFISNYKQIHQKLINDVNNLINQYNSATTESAQNALEDKIESAQKRLDKFKDLYKRYDTLVSDDLKDSIQQIEDLNDSIEDLNISIFQKQLDAADNIKDLHEMIFELNHALHSSIIDDNPFDNFEDHLKELGLYFNDTTMDVNEFYDNLAAKQKEILNNSKSTDAQKKAAQAQLEEIEKVRLEELNGSHTLNPLGTGYLDMALKDTSDISEQIRQFEETGSSEIFGKNSAEMYSVSKDILKKDIDLMTGLKDKVKEVHDDVMDMIDEISDAMDRRAAEYDAINDELEHQLNIIEMIHGDEAYAEMNKVLDVQSAAYKGQLDDLNKQKDIWQKMLDDIGERTEDNKEEWDEVHDKILDTTSQINDLVESSLETLQKKYSNTVSNLTKSWSSSMFGGADLDWMNTEWELINRNADYYLDSTNKAYNIQKLQSKYLDLLDGTNDLNIQRKITDQMGQQLGYLRDKTKLSEYDVQYANAQLEILQKQIALEEAQRNKSQMKLRRDTQGNYSYVYAANDDNVRSAQSDLLDAQNNAYNLSKDQMKQTQADSLSALQDAKSQVDDIWNNANISLEEKKKRTQTIIDSLKEYLAGTSEQLSTSEKNIIQDFIGMCDLLTDENKTGIEDIQNQIIQGNNDAFDQIDTRWATSFTGWLNNLQEFNNNTTAMFDKLVENAKNFDDSVKDLSETSKTNFTDISGSVKGVTDAYNKLNASQNEFLSNLANMSGSVEKGEEALRQYKEEITSLDNQMSVLTKQMQTLTDKNQALERENRELKASAAAAANGGGAGGSGANGGAGGAGSSAASDERLAKRIANSIWMYGDWGTGKTRGNNITKRFSRRIADLVQSYFNGSPAYGYQYRDYSLGFERFDTGGYTGSWYDGGLDSKDGKLALLHQKELILNATDTENILAAVEAVRAFTDNVKTSLLSNLSTAALSKYTATNSNPQDVNQNIHITAEFPAANSASEIEEALMSLNDRAIQYAFKTK